jgi:hypothetical protein
MQYSPVVIPPKDPRMEINIAVREMPPILSKARIPADALNNSDYFVCENGMNAYDKSTVD